MNQYFQLEFKNQNAYIKFFPPKDGGKRVDVNDVVNYLSLKTYQNVNVKDINLGIMSDNPEGTEVFVAPWNGNEVAETMKVTLSLDKMKVFCCFYAPSENGRKLTKEEIKDTLATKNIKYGIDESAIDLFLKERHYCTNYVLAEGLYPIHGKDAKIEYFFNTNINLQPKRNEDGSVDYRELNTISHINKGEILARLIPAEKGESGKNVHGEEIKPRVVKQLKLEFGKNITINEERTELYSNVSGHASCYNGKVFVSDVYEVPADVDNSIGNIDYEGSVHVHGNVKSGFTIRATGDIIIDGIVDNASLIAGGQIIVAHGVHGIKQGVLEAQTNVMAKYIENATVRAGGYVEAEMIINSDVSAGNTVRANGKKGLISGGICRAGHLIEASNIGSQMGTITTIEVGADPRIKERFLALRKDVSSKQEELDRLKLIVNSYGDIIKRGEHLPADKMQYAQSIAIEYKKKKDELLPLQEELMKLRNDMYAAEKSTIDVSRSIYPGVTVSIGELSYHVNDVKNSCRFKKQQGEIVTMII